MADFLPQHRMVVAPPASHPIACDGCGAPGVLTDGELPEGWQSVPIPACEWPFGVYRECGPCAAENGRVRAAGDGATA